MGQRTGKRLGEQSFGSGQSGRGSGYGNSPATPALSIAPVNSAPAATSTAGAGANEPAANSATTPNNGGQGTGTGGSVALAPALIVRPTVFTVSNSVGRSDTSGGTSGRGTTSDHGGSAANEGASNSSGTNVDDATTAGVVNTPGAAGIVATLAPAPTPAISTPAFGVTAGNTGGRAVFGGNTDLALRRPFLGPSHRFG